MLDWTKECNRGRTEAQHDLTAVRETDNLPLFVRKIRDCAADQGGFGVGYLSAIAMKAAGSTDSVA